MKRNRLSVETDPESKRPKTEESASLLVKDSKDEPTKDIKNEKSTKDEKSTKAYSRSHKTKKKQQYGVTSRTKRCGACDGCLREDCGSCQTCRINTIYKNTLQLGGAKCLKKACLKPVSLSSILVSGNSDKNKSMMERMMSEQDDEINPFKEIDGKIYDLRCFICKKLPRAGMANRSELYRHYSLYHYSKELMDEFGHLSNCPVEGCKKSGMSKKGIADHMGQVHNEVHKFVPEEFKIPMKLQKSSRSVKKPRSRRQQAYIFPQIPENYDEKTNKMVPYFPHVVVDGFKVSLDFEEIPSPVVKVPEIDIGEDVEDKLGECCLCNSVTATFTQLLHHLAVGHSMSLEFLPEDKIQFLIRERYLKEATNTNEVDEATGSQDSEAATKETQPETATCDITTHPIAGQIGRIVNESESSKVDNPDKDDRAKLEQDVSMSEELDAEVDNPDDHVQLDQDVAMMEQINADAGSKQELQSTVEKTNEENHSSPSDDRAFNVEEDNDHDDHDEYNVEDCEDSFSLKMKESVMSRKPVFGKENQVPDICKSQD